MDRHEVRARCAALLREQPSLTSTALAQTITGGYTGEYYPRYVTTLLTINKLKAEGEL